MAAEEYLAVAEAREQGGAAVAAALAVVRAFLAERRRVVYGGLAVDLALRAQGGRLYPEGRRPDYDAFSPDPAGDAYELAARLQARGFAEVGVIGAIYLPTMRVRLDLVPVADLSYVPPALLDRLPTLETGGLRLVHPGLQKADIHLSLAFPLRGAPRENLFHRGAKDLARFGLLEAAYPGPPPPLAPPPGGPPAKPGLPALRQVSLAFAAADAALHGLAACELYRAYLEQRLGAAALAAALPAGSGPAGRPAGRLWAGGPLAAVREGGTVRLAGQLPGRPALTGPWPGRLGPAQPHRRAFLDLLPATGRSGEGAAACTLHPQPDRVLAVADLGGVPVVGVQGLLVFLLARGLRRPAFLALYTDMLRLLAAADRGLVGDDFAPFGLNPRLLGEIDCDDACAAERRREEARLAGAPERRLGPPAWRPGQERPPAFDYGGPHFRHDGSLLAES